MDSPRGRIYLMRGLLTEAIEPTPTVLTHLDQCLDCRACETACPSGVEYGSILEQMRTLLEPRRERGVVVQLLRWLLFRKLLPSRRWQWWTFKLLWLQQSLGITAIGRCLARRRLLPERLASLAEQAPDVPFRSFRSAARSAFDPGRGVLFFPARGARRRRVALFTGCFADQLFARVNEATVRVLTGNGCDVEILPGERCCGALHIHNGARDQAKDLARANVAAFNAGNYDAILTNAAGCSAELRRYGELLGHDAAAETFGRKVRDIAEFLEEIGCAPPVRGIEGKVAYAEPCHLLHAQRISAAPRALLGRIPLLQIVPLEDADTCCGSAGIYSFTQPALSKSILARKVDAIRRSGAEIVVTGNPGCILQIGFGLRQAGLRVRVAHPAELLADAYEPGPGPGAAGA
jgi:glycolate oxidase iron-sulfur subunit